MNLALQTRRAVITLSLMALALVCVAAKTATRTDGLSVQTPMRVETMAIDVPAGPVALNVAARAKVRGETRIIRI